MKKITIKKSVKSSYWKGIFAILITLTSFGYQSANAQCTWSANPYASGNAPAAGTSTNITTCAYAGEYATINNCVAGESYTISYNANASAIITIFNSTQTMIAFSTTGSVTFVAATSGTYYSQGNTAGCGSASGCNVIAMTGLGNQTCPGTDSLSVATITSNSAVLNWVETGTATTWKVEYGSNGFAQGTGTLVTVNTTPTLALSSLVSGTTYQWYVTSYCGGSDSSSANNLSFTTNCIGTYSGVYTVNPAASLSATNYHNVDSLVNAMNICGITGAVTINVASGSGPYIEMWNIGNISGASAVNTITINGNGVTINKGVGKNHFVRLDGTKHLTINGFNFVNQTPATAMFGIQMKNACDSISITNNTIDIGMNYTSSASGGIVMSNSNTSATSGGNNANNVAITGNEIIGGYYGIRINGTGTTNKTIGHDINNNNIHDFYIYGLYVNYGDSIFVKNNDLSRVTRALGGTFYGMYFNYTTHAEIMSNKVHDVGAGAGTVYGMQFRYSANTVGSESEIVNNAFYNLKGTGTAYGMYLYGTKSNINVYHNTIDLVTIGGSTRYGIYNTTTTTNMNVKNNLVQISGAGTGTAYGMYFSTTSATIVTDYNNISVHSSGTNYYGRWSSNQATLAGFQTASTQAANSSELNPVFANVAAGNIAPLSMSIDNMGALVGVTTDITGTTRSTTTPDVGAIEFTGIPGDLDMTDATLSQVSACYGSADTAFALVSNLLGSTVDFSTDPLTIVWMVTGPVNTTDSLVVSSGTMDVGSDSIFSISSIDMSSPGNYMVSAYIKPNAVNAGLLNDSIWNVYTETVQPIISVSPDSVTVTSPWDSTELTSTSPLYPAGGFFFSELIQYKASVGTPSGGYPSYSNEDDNVEITGVPNSDMAGVTVEIWTNSALLKSFTFNTGTVLSSSGTVLIGFGSASGSPTNNYYTTGGPSNSTFSSMAVGYILKSSSGSIIDAVASNSYSFPVTSGVTASDWSGTVASSSGTNGQRLVGSDVNSNTGWIVSSNTNRQDPNTVNAGVTVPSPSAVTGLSWDSAGTTVGTDPSYWGGPYTADGVYSYVLSFTNTCGTYLDTAVVTIDLAKATVTTSSNVNCFGADDGTATVTGSGGDEPYTYLWSNGDSTAMADSLSAGSYSVTLTDANMYSVTANIAITEPSAVLAATTSTTPSTCGVPSGSATAVVSGGTTPYTYLWSDGQVVASATGLVGGGYTVTVTDANMCAVVESATVSDIGAPTITIAIDNIVTCFGDSTGQVSATATGGSAPYSYAWSSGGTAATESNLSFGMYTVVLTDNSGCVSNATVNMTQNPALLAVVTGSTDPLCNGDATGTATSIAGGGVAPYSYLWSNGDAIANASALAAGSHSVMVTDAVGCMQTANVNISQPNQLAGIFVNVNDVACNGSSTGSAGILATGGTAPYTYSWSNGSTGSNATALAAGTYSVTIADANNCSMSDNVTIAEPTALVASTTVATDAACFGGATGTAAAMATGGTMPYVYAWSNGAGGTLATGLMAGTYTVSVNDANNCSSTDTIVVGQPASAVSVAVTSTNASCNGISDGGAIAMGAGGTPGYSYSWSNGGSTASVSGLAAGSYAVTTTDANGCMSSSSASVTEPTMLMATATATDVTCNGGNDGQATAMATGGTSPYSYVWSNGPTTALNDTVMAGTYSAVVMDANGCTANASAMVSEPTAIVVNLGADVTICDDDTIVLDAGSGFATYSWSNATSGATASISSSSLGAGTTVVNVMVTNAAGCTGSDSIGITVADPVTTSIIFNGASAICQYESTSMDAGPGFASYTWSNTSNSQSINIYAASQTVGMNTFTVTVTDVNGCEGVAMETVEVYPAVVFNLGADTSVWQNAVFTIAADSGYASYTWNTGATTQNLDVTTAGTYTVVVTDSLTGCAGSDEMVVDFVLSVDAASVAQLKLYPNPAVDYINLEFSNFVQQGVVEIQILSITGQLVKTVNVDVSANNGTGLIDVSRLAVGTYMVTFDYDGQTVVKQFAIK